MENLTSETVKLMTSAIAPVTLISGVGLLLLSMTNRYNQVVIRIRALLQEARHPDSAQERAVISEQIQTLYRRARLLRATVIVASASIFCVGITMVFLFASLLGGFGLMLAAESFFMLSLLFLVASVALFIRDFAISLKAIQQEARHLLGPGSL
jgi:hypothetical protein